MQLRLETLDRAELEKIHNATLAVLDKAGVIVESEEVRDLLEKNGARVNGHIVSFPPDMVEKAISQINKTVRLVARDPQFSLVLPSKNTLNSTSGYAPYIYDMGSSESRPSTTADLIDFAVLADALPEVDLFWPIAMPTEIESPQLQEIAALDIAFRNTTKHVQCSVSDGEAAYWQIKLAAALAGGEGKLREAPLFSVVSSPLTPLTFKKGTSEAYLHMARAGIPVVPMNMPMAGTTAPVTIAGTIVMANAEQLATLVILKCADKDAPMVYASDTATGDMTTGELNYDSPERPVLCASLAQIARHYGLPSSVSHDSAEDKFFDLDTGFEYNALILAMNGMSHSDLAAWMGSRDDALACSLCDLLLDAETVKMAREYNRSFEVNDRTLAVDVITATGPGNHYLNCKHTVKNFRKELSIYDYEDSFIFEDEDADFLEVAKAKVHEILKSHKPVQIPEEKLRAMDDVIAEARKLYNGK